MSSFHRTRLIPFLPVPVHFHPLPMWGCCYLWGPVVFRGRMFLSLSAVTTPTSWFILLYISKVTSSPFPRFSSPPVTPLMLIPAMPGCCCLSDPVVLRGDVLLKFLLAHRGSLELFHQLPALVGHSICVFYFFTGSVTFFACLISICQATEATWAGNE